MSHGPNIIERAIVRLGRVGYDAENGEPEAPFVERLLGSWELSASLVPTLGLSIEARDDSGFGPGAPAIALTVGPVLIVARRWSCYEPGCLLEPGHLSTQHESPAR